VGTADREFFAFVEDPFFSKHDFLYFGKDFPTSELQIAEECKRGFNYLSSWFNSLIAVDAETILDFKLHFQSINS
jgi:hypothetical protein